MAFDPEIHTIHPETGFMVHKETGHVVGLQGAPHRPVTAEKEWPKWVKPHANHVHRQRAAFGPQHLSTPQFVDFHVDRDNEVTVLVHDAEQEARALADPHALREPFGE